MLNETGSAIWGLLDSQKSLEELCKQLKDEYEIDLETCNRETAVIESLSESVKHRQVRIYDGLNCVASWFSNSCTRYIGPKNATPNELQYPARKHFGQWLFDMTSHDGVKACNIKY